MNFNATCLSAALVAAKAAGPRILEIYQSTFTVEYKENLLNPWFMARGASCPAV